MHTGTSCIDILFIHFFLVFFSLPVLIIYLFNCYFRVGIIDNIAQYIMLELDVFDTTNVQY